MKALNLLPVLVLTASVSQASVAAERPPVDIVVKQLNGVIDGSHRALVAREASLGGLFVPKKTLTWTFRNRSGSFLLAEVKAKGSTRCVLYLEREREDVALGGNDHCKWRKDPVLVWDGNKAWLEFPRVIRQPRGRPRATNELTAHFSKAAGDVCLLGLPLAGYDMVRCPDDEAPDSR